MSWELPAAARFTSPPEELVEEVPEHLRPAVARENALLNWCAQCDVLNDMMAEFEKMRPGKTLDDATVSFIKSAFTVMRAQGSVIAESGKLLSKLRRAVRHYEKQL